MLLQLDVKVFSKHLMVGFIAAATRANAIC